MDCNPFKITTGPFAVQKSGCDLYLYDTANSHTVFNYNTAWYITLIGVSTDEDISCYKFNKGTNMWNYTNELPEYIIRTCYTWHKSNLKFDMPISDFLYKMGT